MPRLVLSAHLHERIMVGDSVVVTLVKAEKGKVRLLFEAPAEVAIDRECVRLAKIEEREVRS